MSIGVRFPFALILSFLRRRHSISCVEERLFLRTLSPPSTSLKNTSSQMSHRCSRLSPSVFRSYRQLFVRALDASTRNDDQQFESIGDVPERPEEDQERPSLP